MFSKMRGMAIAAGILGLGVVAVPNEADAQIVAAPLRILGTSIAVECKNPGSHQDVAKTPIIRNTTGATIKKGKAISWKSSDGDHGSITLAADLPVNGTVSAIGQPGNGYSCTSAFVTSADLRITSAYLGANSQGVFTIQNLDSWVDSPLQVVRFEVMSCSGNQVLASVDTSPFAMPKTSGKSLSITLPPTSGKRYVRVTADATKKVGEFNEVNNVYAPMDTCVY